MSKKMKLKKKNDPKETIATEIHLPFFKNIIHISDIHIRPLKRHDEFQKVFEATVKAIELIPESIIVLTGDLFDNKTTFHPETFLIGRNFLKSLAQVAPVLVIAGNHDMYENNQNRLDAITPIADDIANLHYLKQSGLYYIPSTKYCFVVSSLSDKQFIHRQDIQPIENYKYIALYHGAITGAQTDIGYEVEDSTDGGGSSRYRSLSDFAGFDAVLLGDIHKHQIKKIQNMDNAYLAYAGSLIQQNHGETRHGHGILIWDEHLNCKLKEIPNEYGFADIYCENGIWTNDYITLPNKCYTRLIIKNSTEEQINIIIGLLKTRAEWIFIEKRQCLNDIIKESEIPPDVQRIDDEIDLLKGIATEYGFTEIDDILNLHYQYQTELNASTNQDMNTAVWKPIRLEFQNLFGYGGDVVNRVDFTTGVTCISAANARGKTSFVNILLFGIFGKTLLNPSGSSYTFDIVNTGYTNGYVKLLMNYGGEYYTIERKSVKKKTSSKAAMALLNNYEFTCNFWRSDETGALLENLRDIKKKNTDTAIIDMFGDISDFALSNLLNKESQVDLLTMTPSEQIRTLKRIFRLEIYDAYRDLNKKKHMDVEQKISTLIRDKQQCEAHISLKQPDSTSDLDLENDAKEYNLLIEDMTENLSNLEQEKISVQEEIQNLKDKLEPEQEGQNKQHNLQDLKLRLSAMKKKNIHLKDTGIPAKSLAYKIELLKQDSEYMEPVPFSEHPDTENYTLSKVQIKIDRLTDELSRIMSQELSDDPFPQKNQEDLELELKCCKTQLNPVHTNFEMLELKLNAYNEEDLFDEDVTQLQLWKIETVKKIRHFEKQIYDAELKLNEYNQSRSKHKPLESRESLIQKLIETPFNNQIKLSENKLHSFHKELQQLTDVLNAGERGRVKTFINVLRSDHLDTEIREHLIAYLEEKYSGVQDNTISITMERIKQLEYEIKKYENTKIVNSQIAANKIIEADIAEYDYRDVFKNIKIWRKECEQLKMEVLIMETRQQSSKAYQEFQELQTEYSNHLHNRQIEAKLQIIKQSIDWKRLMTLRSEKDYFEQILKSLKYKAYLAFSSKQNELADIEEQYTIQQDYEKYIALKTEISRCSVLKNNEIVRSAISEYEATLDAIQHDILGQQAELKTIQEKYNSLLTQIQLAHYKQTEYEKYTTQLNAVSAEIIKEQKRLVPFECYNKLMSNRGIPCKLLYMKIKAIEGYINRIIETFTKYRVHILYDDTKQSITIITENKITSEHLSIQRLSGFEKLMLQVAFKRALNKFSYNSKSSLIIIDEALDCIDNENFHSKLPEIMNMIAQDYAIAIAISQRDISHISDRAIKINTENGYSKLYI